MPLYHYHPPKPTDEKWYNQTEPSECSIEELEQLRKLPEYTTKQKAIQIVLFLIFGIFKIVTAISFALISGPFFLVAAAIWRSLNRPESWRSFLKKVWASVARIFLFLLGFHRIRYHGQLDPEARFIIGNHTCFFDGWLFLPFGPRPLGKKEMLNIPIIREMSDIYQGIPVDRSKNTGVAKLLVELASDKNSPLIMIMPEGASTSGDYMLRFHLGAFLSDLPVQPCSIRYTLYGTTRSISHISFFHNHPYHWIVFLGIPSITIDITLMPSMSIKTDGENDPRKFADATSLRIANDLGVRLLSLSSNSIYKKAPAAPQPAK
ncbi:Acyltransferase family protein [Tritrichomonas foetus]|uniref:Acyltransferase family protein n=1 Tax=Tritrichomonas foetus TaxID=1144522 RepID=A0A1J4JSN6_9EUKA|nr:Acyltransferase family protein [Tritrichomonas foetus]|eukprot:OHT02143.1 Acyltransferase family protein [Tritrichomonas foetus]